MTLIITAGNSEQFIQVSDRRLTINGALQDDESNKAVVINCVNARLAFGFTGLAKAGDFETRKWLLSTINECGPPDYSAQSVLERVKEKATQAFQTIPVLESLPKSKKRLTVMFSGYLYHHDPPLGGLAILTNFQDIYSNEISTDAWKHFKCFYREEPRPYDGEVALLYAIGSVPPIGSKPISELVSILKARSPGKAIIGKLIEIFHRIAELPESQGLIGKQLNSISLPRDRNLPAESGYHSGIVKSITYLPDQIYIVSQHLHLNVTDVSVEPVFKDSSLPISGPELKSNQPCWCKSGKKYKYCHGRKSKDNVKIQIVAKPDKEEY
jgi:hypothetical protein